MGRDKISITVDRATLNRASALVETRSVSDLIDVALTRLIEDELARVHVAGYELMPPSEGESAWGSRAQATPEIDDDVDWAALYGVRK